MTPTANGSASTSDVVVTLGHLRCRYLLPAGTDDGPATADVLTRLAGDAVRRRCAERLDALLAGDDGVYRIRRLGVTVWLDPRGMTAQEMSRRWGDLLATAIVRELRRPNAAGVRRFDGMADFLAAFVRDLVDGRAWRHWPYAQFRPLERLGTGGAALHVLAGHPAEAGTVLTALTATGHHLRLVASWDAAQVDRLWQALGLPATTAVDPRVVRPELVRTVAAAVASAATTPAADRTSVARRRLLSWVALARDHPTTARDAAAVALLSATVELSALLHAHPDVEPLLAMASPVHPRVAERIAAGPHAGILSWLLPMSAARPADLARLATAVAGLVPPLSSPVGSVGLVLPALVDLGLWGRWQDEHGEERARQLIVAVLLKALGRRRALFALDDPVVAALAGLDRMPPADARVPPETDAGQPRWARDLADRARRAAPLAAVRTPRLAVLVDAGTGRWAVAAPLDGDADAWGDGSRPARSDEAERVAGEAAHLQLGPRFGYGWLTGSLDAALSVVASQVLGRTASRLPGFTRTGPSGLAARFLAHPATLARTSHPWELTFGPGPAGLILRMADLPDEVAVPWLGHGVRLVPP